MDDSNKFETVKSIDELRRMSRVSNSSFLRSFSLNSSADASLKRKLPDEYDGDASIPKKDSRIGSPLMSPWEFRRLRGDLADAQTQIVRLEDRIDQLHKKNKEAVIFFDQEKAEMKSQLEIGRQRIEKLETKINKMRCQDAEFKADMYDIQRILEKKVLDKEQKIQELKNDKAQLQLELAEVEEHSDKTEMELRKELEKAKTELVELKLGKEENVEQTANAQARLAVALEDTKDLELLRIELQKANDRIQELESERAEMEEARSVVTVLQHRVLKLNEIDAELSKSKEEVAQLKMAVQNKVLIEEKMHDMEIKMAGYVNREKEFISLKEKNFDLETELERWGAMVETCCGGNTREQLQAYLTLLHDNELQHSTEKNSLQAQMEDLTFKLKSTTAELATVKDTAEATKQLVGKMKTEVQMMRRKIALVTRERDSYRQQLDMFEKDLTVSGGGGGSGTQDRVQELEAVLQGYREQMTTLEEQLKLYRDDDTVARIEATRKLEQELKNAQAECERLSARRDQLEVMLEERVQKGSHPSPNTKVLHFRNNPCALAEEQQSADVAELHKECDRLRARIRLLEAGEKLDLTVRSAADAETGPTARLRDLEEQLESAMLKNTRLKEVFKRTSQDFRDVSYMLLGYRIDLVSNKVYRLTNMYSDDPEDHFMFQLNRSGMMEMLQTAYTDRLSDLVNRHLLENNSIPCFLSAVTLSLHNTGEEESAPPTEPEASSEEELEPEEDEGSESEESEGPIEVEISD